MHRFRFVHIDKAIGSDFIVRAATVEDAALMALAGEVVIGRNDGKVYVVAEGGRYKVTMLIGEVN